MSGEMFAQLLQSAGPVGLVLIAALLALRHVHAKYVEAVEARNEVQEKRVADAQLVAQNWATSNARQHEINALLAKAIDGNADAVRELRIGIESALAERGVHRLPSPVTDPGRRR